MPNFRRLTHAAVATAVALPFTTVVLAAPSFAADWPQPGGPSAYGYGFGSPYAGHATAVTDTSVATASQETGLVEVDSTVDFGEGLAAGTGIVVGSDGLVATNHHVVEGATSIKVTVVATGQSYTADVVGYSARKDVAVLQLEDATGLTTAPIASTAAGSGDQVTAVGDAGGDGGDLTAAPGTVTATGQKITVTNDDGSTSRLRSLLEVTSDVVPGDSGGALLDAAGDVVGMNVAASSGSADVTGYVIPIARVLRVERAVLAGQTPGDVALGYSAFLGVTLPAADGAAATIAGVLTGSPAAGAGLAAGDTITAVGETPVATARQLRAAVAAHDPGDTVSVTWTATDDTTHTASLTLERGPVG